LVESLERSPTHLAYADTDIVELAGIYAAGTVQNHLFSAGKKRICLVVGALFFELNGFRFIAGDA
jgi:prophage maintenance system killer protein